MTTEIKHSNIEMFLEMLVDNVARIETDTADLDEVRFDESINGEWSIVQIFAHLRACDAVWTNSIYQMLVTENPNLPDTHPNEWAQKVDFTQFDFAESFALFQLKRYELFRVLTSLDFEDWERSCVINGRSHTVFSQVRRMALHEARHCDDIEILCQ